jgi:uncharacterized repeat protein (TIGR02543 family)
MKKALKFILGIALISTFLAGCSTSPSTTSNGSNEPDNSISSANDDITYVTATFVVGEGVDSIPSQTVVLGDKFKNPQDPIKDEYTFGGWYTNDSYSSPFDFTISYTTDQTIYAKWDLTTYEYYLYGNLNFTDVWLPSIYKQEEYRLKKPNEEDNDTIAVLYNWHIMPSDELHIIRFGSDGSEVTYEHEHEGEYKRGYYDILLHENGISLRFIRYDEWILNFLADHDAGDVYASFTKAREEGDYIYFELKDFKVTANQKLFLSYAWKYNPDDYFGFDSGKDEWPIINDEEWVKVVYVPSVYYGDGSTPVYEFQKDATYKITVCVRKDCTYNDENLKVTFSLIDDSEVIYQNGIYNLPAILPVWENYVKGNNTYQVDLVTGMLSARMSYGSTKLIDINEEKITFYIFAKNREMPNTPQFKTFEITCPTIISNIKNHTISTQTQLASALYNFDAQYFNVTQIISIDTSIDENEVLSRAKNLLAKVGSDADVLFAYETAPGAADLTYGNGFTYDSVVYTSDSKLHVFHVCCLSKEDVLNDTDKYGVNSDNVTNIYEQNLDFYQNA